MCGAEAENTYEFFDRNGTRTPILSDQWKKAYGNATGNLGPTGFNATQQTAVNQFQPNLGLLQDNLTGFQANTNAIRANNAWKPVQQSAVILNNDLMGNRNDIAALGGQYSRFANQDAPQAVASSGADFISRYTEDPTAAALLKSSTDDYLTTTDRARNARLLNRDAAGAFGDRAAVSDATFDADSVRGLNSLTSGIRSSIYDRAVGAGLQDASLATGTSQFNANAQLQNRGQQMDAIAAQERNIAAQTGISQQILQNVITNNQVNMDGLQAEQDGLKAESNAIQINMDAATKLFQAGQISQQQLNELAKLARESNGQAFEEEGSKNNTRISVDGDIF